MVIVGFILIILLVLIIDAVGKGPNPNYGKKLVWSQKRGNDVWVDKNFPEGIDPCANEDDDDNY